MAVPSHVLERETIYELLNGFLYKDEQIPSSFLKKFMTAVGASQNAAAKLLGIATRTLQRELTGKLLSKELSDRFLQVMDLYKEGIDAFYSIDTFRQWLSTSKATFQGKTPYEMMHSITGVQQVKEEIIRTKLGILS
ncbi:MAG: antitoxin Xre/MbcA/ParS toxin-binding domain-containing protein [Bacteroidota bacterium]